VAVPPGDAGPDDLAAERAPAEAISGTAPVLALFRRLPFDEDPTE